MTVAGVDVGLKYTKVVILRDGKIIGKSIGLSGGVHRAKAVERIWREALENAGLAPVDIDKAVATGQGKTDAPFVDKCITEAVAAARAARAVRKDSAFVVDCGADQARVVALGEGNEIREAVLNQKCMAGMGLLIETMADRLEMSLDQMCALQPGANGTVLVNDGCPVFAEMDALELLNQGVSREEVAKAATYTVIVRLNSILHDKVFPAKNATVLIGGLSKNKAVVEGLKKRSGIDFIIPEDAEYGCALGAAAVAAALPV